MKKGEICIVQIPPEYGFGDEEKQCDSALVPANSTLTYEIEMISFIKVYDVIRCSDLCVGDSILKFYSQFLRFLITATGTCETVNTGERFLGLRCASKACSSCQEKGTGQ